MLDADSISIVLDALEPERARLLETLGHITSDDWARATECPSYTVKGITKDNFIFGVRAVDRDGNRSVVSFPVPK